MTDYNKLINTQENNEGNFIWLITFADLLSLLVAFFIMIFAMSTLKQNEWNIVNRSFTGAFNAKSIHGTLNISEPVAVNTINEEVGLNIDYLYTIISERIKENKILTNSIRIQNNIDRINIIFSENFLFDFDSNNVSKDGQVVLFGIGEVLQQITNKIEILGKFSANSINSINYDSNWELTLQRATTIGEQLKKLGLDTKIDVFTQTKKPIKTQQNKSNNLNKEENNDQEDQQVNTEELIDPNLATFEIIIRSNKANKDL